MALGLGLFLFVLALVGFARFAAQVQSLRARHATGPGWSFPSRVYSDGVPFLPGRPLPARYLALQLEARGYRETRPPAAQPGTWARTTRGVEIALRGFTAMP